MDLVRLVLLFVHLIAMAALLGGLLVQAKDDDKRITAWVRDGAGTAFLAGLLLVGVLEGLDADVNHAKIGVKLGIGLVVLVLAMSNVRKNRISDRVWGAMVALTIINVAVAVFWSPAHQTADDAAAPAATVSTVSTTR